MFDHVTIRAVDRAASERFYNTVLQTLGIDESYRTRTFTEWQDFGLTEADGEHPASRRLHIGFAAPHHARVEAFWRAGLDARHRHDGPPRARPQDDDGHYGALLHE